MLYDANTKLEPEWAQTESGLIIPSDCRPQSQPKAFDFFAGCGGMSLGLHQAGIHVVGAMEWEPHAALTYLVNLGEYGKLQIHFDDPKREEQFNKLIEKEWKRKGLVVPPVAGSGRIGSRRAVGNMINAMTQEGRDDWEREWGSSDLDLSTLKGCEHFWIADIRNITGEMILKELGMQRGDLDIVAGGPPCQGFSQAGKQNIFDPRNSLVFEFARLIVELAPKTFIFENVPGILDMTTPEGVPVMDEFCNILAMGDYTSYEAARKMLGLESKLRRGVRKQISKKAAYENKGKANKPKKTGVKAPALQPSMF